MPDYSLSMGQAAPINPNIPLQAGAGVGQVQAPQPVDIQAAQNKQQQQQAQQMKQQMELQNSMREANDNAIIQAYKDSGAKIDLSTPDGLKDFIGKVGVKLSPEAQSKYSDLLASKTEADVRLKSIIAKTDADHIQQWRDHQDFLAENVAAPLVKAYDTEFAKSRNAEDARRAMRAAALGLSKSLSGMKSPTTGQPLFTQEELSKLESPTIEDVHKLYDNSAYARGVAQADLTRRKTEAEIGHVKAETASAYAAAAEHKAKADAAKMGGAMGVEFDNLPPATKKAVDDATWDYIINGKEPPARGGLYQQVHAHAADIADSLGKSVADLRLASGDTKAQLNAMRTFEARVQNTARAENMILSELPVVKENLNALKLPSVPAVARAKLFALQQSGDPAATKFKQSMDAVMNEFEGIVTGNPGALNVSDVQHARDTFKEIATPQQLNAWMENTKTMIERAKSSQEKTRGEILGGITKQFKKEGERQEPDDKKQGGVQKISSDKDYDALPSGAEFIAPDGSRRRKP